MRKQHYMTYNERQKLEALHRANIPVMKIAQQLGFCRQTIYNELRRGAYLHDYGWYSKTQYAPDKAQQLHTYAQTGKGRPLKIGNDYEYTQFLEDKMLGRQPDGTIDKRQRYSPAAALEAARTEGYTTSICKTTLYSYIDKRVFLHITNKDLWEKSKKKKRTYQSVQRIAHPALPSIADRPEQINRRLEPGHWEMDLIVGKKNTRAALLTLTERLTRQELIFWIPNKKAETICAVFNRLERKTRNFRQKFRSITTDNGSEFLQYENLCRSVRGGKRFDLYYCHSYAAWEKGSCENVKLSQSQRLLPTSVISARAGTIKIEKQVTNTQRSAKMRLQSLFIYDLQYRKGKENEIKSNCVDCGRYWFIHIRGVATHANSVDCSWMHLHQAKSQERAEPRGQVAACPLYLRSKDLCLRR